MRENLRFFPLGRVYIVLLFAAAGLLELNGQSLPRNVPPKSSAPEDLSQAELLEAYRTMREQLRSTQTAIITNRFETEATAREQAAVIAEKIDAMNASLAAERKNRQTEADRFEFVRQQQQMEIRRSNRSVVWVASFFGSVGLLAMVSAAFFQWRAISRMAEVVAQRPPLAGPSGYGLLPEPTNSSSSPSLTLSTQRLLSAIDRMEQRIGELEHTTAATSSGGSSPAQPPSQTQEVIL